MAEAFAAWPDFAASEAIDDSGDYAGVVLAVALGVGDSGVDVVDFGDGDGEVVADAGGDAAAAHESEGLAVDVELEVDVFLGSAEEDLSVGDPAGVIAFCVTDAEEVVDDGDVLRGAVDLAGVGDGEVGYTGPDGGNVVGEGGTASVEGEASALARWGVGVDVVVVKTGLHARDVSLFEA